MESKIKEEELIGEILKVVPEFKIALDEEEAYWETGIPDGMDVAAFSNFIYEEISKEHPDKDLLQRCFDAIEYLLEHGDEAVKNNMYFMVIESLTNRMGHNGLDEDIARSYMGPRSKRALDRINDFWMKGKIIESLD